MSRSCRGFTLVEILVVLVIAGFFVSLVASIARPDEKALLGVESERLARLFEVAATESRLTGKTIAWTTDGGQYRFWRFRGNSGWTTIGDGETLRSRALPIGITISGLQVENMSTQTAGRLEFSAYGPATAFVVRMTMGENHYAVVGSPVGDVRIIPGQAISSAAATP